MRRRRHGGPFAPRQPLPLAEWALITAGNLLGAAGDQKEYYQFQ